MSENNLQVSAWRQAKFWLMLVGIVLVAGIAVISLLRDRITNRPFQQVTITGQGKVAYTPDLAIVTLGVQIDKVVKAEDALNQLNAKMDSIIQAVKGIDIVSSDIQTQNYSLYPQYDYKDNISSVSGYNANQQLVIKVANYDKDPARLNKVIAAASKAGANQVAGLTFDSSILNDLKQQARVKAIEDAKNKSGELAAAAGVQLKEVSGWWENTIQPLPYSSYGYEKGGMGAGGAMTTDPQITGGSREVIVEVGVTYYLK